MSFVLHSAVSKLVAGSLEMIRSKTTSAGAHLARSLRDCLLGTSLLVQTTGLGVAMMCVGHSWSTGQIHYLSAVSIFACIPSVMFINIKVSNISKCMFCFSGTILKMPKPQQHNTTRWDGPMDPHYSTKTSQSFQNWPASSSQSAENLREAGFFYSGEAQKT
jgi:hypothetical protein